MANYPLISVLCPVYNQIDFIRDALDSVLAQNYPNLEIIIGDDCSTDGTIEILKHYEEQFPDIVKVIYNQENLGVTENCNSILKNCTGEFLAFFAGDDIWLPNKLIRQMDFLKENPNFVLCYTKTGVFINYKENIVDYQPKIDYDELKKRDVFDIVYNLGSSMSSFLIRRNAIPEEGYNKNIPTVSDWLFMVEVLNNREFGGLNELLTLYRRHNNNLSRDLELIYIEHLLSLKIAEKKYPELNSIIDDWKSRSLFSLISENKIMVDKIVTTKNASLYFKAALKELTLSQVIKMILKKFIRQ